MARQARKIPAYSYDPTLAWDREKVHQHVEILQPQDWKSTKPENHTRFVCISGELATVATVLLEETSSLLLSDLQV